MILKPIGVVHSLYRTRTDAPRQGRFGDAVSELEIYPEYTEGLHLLERNRYLIVLTWFHLAERHTLRVLPPHRQEEHGVFATRSPDRPNPIGISLVKLLGIEKNRIFVQWLDAIDGTPLLDIKPFSRDLDCVNQEENVTQRGTSR
ncbi:MAG: tRNA (N6-threonylcarbamoyladenosine(37)-N6)-methyltransferase TrmO [Methanomicrobiales archaeon]|nr:tRNA (N6-threonylcarbamoyladenosine(37)-N6)-methyltransferase TrmO [Methanomicrobiales archaeon]MDI6875186.1 tRNA (N6-threonylcarbamoyladenosine(37)-N6)-methyltransferase TrmO [Methanomicrobiales archaeon]